MEKLQSWVSLLQLHVRVSSPFKKKNGSHVPFFIPKYCGFQSFGKLSKYCVLVQLLSSLLVCSLSISIHYVILSILKHCLAHENFTIFIACNIWLSLMHGNLIFRPAYILGARPWRSTLFSREACIEVVKFNGQFTSF